MKAGIFFSVLLLGGSLTTQTVSGEVFLRVSQGELPSAETLGVQNLVFVWPVSDASFVTKARALGYRVFFEAQPGDFSVAADAAERVPAAGVILDIDIPAGVSSAEALRRVEADHPKLSFRSAISGGKEPQIKGRLVVDRDGILQVSSPTSQPWVDSNLALIKFAGALHPEATALYSFHWNLSDARREKLGPSAEDYSLAIAEADAFHADVIVDLHEAFEKGLAHNEAVSWSVWNKVKRYITFQIAERTRPQLAVADTGVLTDDYRSSYESINLMARHNIPVVLLHWADLGTQKLDGLNTLVIFSAPTSASSTSLGEFAKQGGIVVLVNQHGDFPWHSGQPVRRDAHSAAYNVGIGQIVELGEPVIDPEAFARDLRRLMGTSPSFSLWNSLTTVVVAYRTTHAGELVLELVNYAQEPEPVQVQVRGHFSSIQYESPEDGCCQFIAPVEHDGSTEFVLPALFIHGRVRLKTESPPRQ